MAVGEGGAFADEPVKVGGFHVVETEFTDRIKALLVRDDENDIGSSVCAHSGSELPERGGFVSTKSRQSGRATNPI